jgi:cilia- and flagella-associated protein 99
MSGPPELNRAGSSASSTSSASCASSVAGAMSASARSSRTASASSSCRSDSNAQSEIVLPTGSLAADAVCKHMFTLVSTYNSERMTPPTHLQEYVSQHRILQLPEYENITSLLQEVFYGTLRHCKLIRLTVDSFYHRFKGDVLRQDRTMYEVVLYLTLFRFDELGFASYSQLVCSQPKHNVAKLLRFLYDPELFPGWHTTQWSTIYDRPFVEQTLVAALSTQNVKLDRLVNTRLDPPVPSANGTTGSPSTVSGAPNAMTTTVVEPFNLSTPMKKSVLVPKEPEVKEFRHNPLPENINKVTLKKLDAKRNAIHADNVAKVKAKHAGATAFVSNMEKLRQKRAGEKARKAKEKADKEERARQKAARKKAAQVKRWRAAAKAPAPPVNMTAAATLREEALIKKRREEQAALIRAYEAELKDSTDFDSWREDMIQVDRIEEIRQAQQRKIEMEQSQQNAIEAAQRAREENQEMAREAREETNRLIELEKQRKQKELELARENVMQIDSEKIKAKHAVEKVNSTKKKEAAVKRQTAERMRRQRERRKQRELKEKRKLIREIQAMEQEANARAKRPKEFDPTETAGHMLMEEMSMVELHERLHLLKLVRKEEVERKRNLILLDKKEQREKLANKRSYLSKVRNRAKAMREADKISATQKKERMEKEAANEADKWRKRFAKKRQHKRDAAMALYEQIKLEQTREELTQASIRNNS